VSIDPNSVMLGRAFLGTAVLHGVAGVASIVGIILSSLLS
jgi:hypothetical protein